MPRKKMPEPLCDLTKAIFILAGQSRQAPEDPCRGTFDVLPQHRPSRWLLSFLLTLRTLMAWTDDGDPPAPEAWRQLEPRLGLRSEESLWPFDLDEIWRDRIDSMRGHCDTAGMSPAAWVAAFAPYEAAAMAHLEACERREAAMIGASVMLRVVAMRNGGLFVCGMDARSGRFGRISRLLLFDPTMEWVSDPSARRYDRELVFTGGLRTATADYAEIVFAQADIDAIVTGAKAAGAAPTDRTLASAVRSAALELFPGGPPAGIRARTRDDMIATRVVEMGGAKPSERTMREGLRGLWPRGARRRRT
jgi:hypothetical protein